MTAGESAVLVPGPEAEPVVGRHRARLDRAAVEGVPAHVTVLYPFVPPPEITAATIEVLAAAVRSVAGPRGGERCLRSQPVRSRSPARVLPAACSGARYAGVPMT